MEEIVREKAIKYHVFSYYSFLQTVPFNEIKKVLKDKNCDDFIKIGLRVARKEQFDLERENRFSYYLRSFEQEKNDFFDNLCLVNHIVPQNFALDMKAWLNCSHKRKNGFFLQGKISTGKSLIAKLLSKVFITTTFINNSSGSQFCFGNLLYSNIIIIDEPFIPPPILEDFKSLLGGSDMVVDVKYSTFEVLYRTPILITSNFSSLSRGYAASDSENSIKSKCYCYNLDTFLETPQDFNVTPGMLLYFLNKY